MSRPAFLASTLTCICLLAAAAGASPAATGGTIDPGLAAALTRGAPGDPIDILVVLDRGAAPEPADLEPGLRGADPATRRREVAAELSKRTAEALAAPLARLAALEKAGRAGRVRRLWLAGAIACRVERSLVPELAALAPGATVLEDRPYFSLGHVRRDAAAAGAAAAAGPAAGPAAAATAGLAAVPTDTAWGVKWVRANRVWLDTGYRGDGVLVAHLDSGVWVTHPDLAGRLWTNPGEGIPNGLDDDGDGYVDDLHGWDFADRDGDVNDDVVGADHHGTHTAGTVCGDGTAGTVTGCAPRASLLVCKVFYSDGSGAPFGAVWEARQYAVLRGARILTMSAGVAGALPGSFLAAERRSCDALRAAGVIDFNSAGNDHYNYDPPEEIGATARVPAPWSADPTVPYTSLGGVVAVGGTGYKSNTVYLLSSQGPVTWADIGPWLDWPYLPGAGLVKPDVCAPGTNVNSTLPPSGYSGDTWSGTSMACPHVAGVAALMLQKNPSLSPAGIDSILEQTAVDLGTVGKDNVFGSGLIDALAAVNAVPPDLRPHLVWRRTSLDPSGDGSLDPGETADLAVELANNSPVVGAAGVVAALAVTGNPYVSVVDASGSWPDLPAGGSRAFNLGDPFRLSAAPGTPVGTTVAATLTVGAAGGWQRTFDLELSVGNPHHRTHDEGSVYLTVTDQGILGYMSDALLEGDGFGDASLGLSDLYVGSLWAGTGQTYICNRDYAGSGAGTETYEWVAASPPLDRVRDASAGGGSQVFTAVFTDLGHATPVPVTVSQTSHAWADPQDDDFVILAYTIRNDGAAALTDYYVGVFCDFDIGSYDSNEGGTDAGRHLTWMSGDTGACCGISLVQPQAHRNLTLINNPTYTYPLNAIEDGTKGRFLKGLASTPTSTAPDDWSALTSAGPFTLAPGDSLRVAFALLRAPGLAALQAAADRAALMYRTTDAPGAAPPPRAAMLAQNRPNPFNPRTSIRFSLARQEPVRLEIYDLAGRLVRVLSDGTLGPGGHEFIWDGRDDGGAGCPSGLYVYRLHAGRESLSRKMMLVR